MLYMSLRTKNKYSIEEIHECVFRYQETGDEESLRVITEACTPIILKQAARYSTYTNRATKEVISDFFVTLYRYIPKYKKSKYHFLQSFKMYLSYNKTIDMCHKAEMAIYKLPDSEKGIPVADLKKMGIVRSRNGVTHYTYVNAIDTTVLDFSPETSSDDAFDNNISVLRGRISDDCNIYLDNVLEGYTEKEIISMTRKGEILFSNKVNRRNTKDILIHIEHFKNTLKHHYISIKGAYDIS